MTDPGAADDPRWPAARLDALRQIGDPDVDPIAALVYEQGGPAAIGKLARQLDDWEAPLPDDVHPRVREYFAAAVSYPPWVEQSGIRRAEHLFAQFGPMTLSALLLHSYPLFLSCPAGAHAMYNARLFSPESVASRMLELAQFSIFMGERHGLSIDGGDPLGGRQGRSFMAYRKLRLIHAGVRALLNAPESARSWDRTAYGAPINQEDLALAMLCFSVGTIEGLQNAGFVLSAEDQEGFLMAWRAATWLLGLVDELQPGNIGDARRLRDRILARHQRATPQAAVVVREMLHVVEGLLPPGTRRVPAALMRFQLGPRVADLLDVPNPRLLVGLLRVTQPLWKTTGLFAALSKLISPRLLTWATAPNRLGGNRRLTVPPKLAARLGTER